MMHDEKGYPTNCRAASCMSAFKSFKAAAFGALLGITSIVVAMLSMRTAIFFSKIVCTALRSLSLNSRRLESFASAPYAVRLGLCRWLTWVPQKPSLRGSAATGASVRHRQVT